MTPCPHCGYLEGHKRCSECGEYLPADAEHFTRDRSHKDGLGSRCRACDSQRRKPKGTRRNHLTISERLERTRQAELVAIAQDALAAYGAFRRSGVEGPPQLDDVMERMGERLRRAVGA